MWHLCLIVSLPLAIRITKDTSWPSSDCLFSTILPVLFHLLVPASWTQTSSSISNMSAETLPFFFAVSSCFLALILIRSSCFISFLIIEGRPDLIHLLKNLSYRDPLPSWEACWLIPNTTVLRVFYVKEGNFRNTSLILLTDLSAGELLWAL